MKQHAILIETHTNVDLLVRVLNKMQSENHYFFIHVDKKTKNYNEFLALKSDHVIFTSKRFDVKWGSVEQIYLTIELLNTAKKFPVNFDYYHLISGQDYPIKSNLAFDYFFDNTEQSFMELDWNNPILPRLMYYHFNGLFNVKKRGIGEKLERHGINLQKDISKYILLRKPLKQKLYKGSNWWSLHNKLVDYILQYINSNPNYLKRFHFTSCCDEVFFHTIAFNSPLKETIELTDLRYYDWKQTYPTETLPRTLTEKDYGAIINSKSFFCRKVDLKHSLLLLNLIDSQQ